MLKYLFLAFTLLSFAYANEAETQPKAEVKVAEQQGLKVNTGNEHPDHTKKKEHPKKPHHDHKIPEKNPPEHKK